MTAAAHVRNQVLSLDNSLFLAAAGRVDNVVEVAAGFAEIAADREVGLNEHLQLSKLK